ncbi:hypothetical protein K443DRAFT_678092 [Laccaria amethystina LaAM-08-1]|uniref:Uncharacterized protein n=1 Tax=Laccaria amethystina LaAM-08-1 TaxID=1095629 RepID=A0A0C9XW17_9AGAR|nr:hypothetical protein K443DRAFT_678092 [Laccaria amethystina LaAM-08-1]
MISVLLFLKHTRFLLTQSIGLALCTIWIFAGLVAFDFYFHTRSARVKATIGGVAVPQAVISAVEKQLGVANGYQRTEYLVRLVALIPWFTAKIRCGRPSNKASSLSSDWDHVLPSAQNGMILPLRAGRDCCFGGSSIRKVSYKNPLDRHLS